MYGHARRAPSGRLTTKLTTTHLVKQKQPQSSRDASVPSWQPWASTCCIQKWRDQKRVPKRDRWHNTRVIASLQQSCSTNSTNSGDQRQSHSKVAKGGVAGGNQHSKHVPLTGVFTNEPRQVGPRRSRPGPGAEEKRDGSVLQKHVSGLVRGRSKTPSDIDALMSLYTRYK